MFMSSTARQPPQELHRRRQGLQLEVEEVVFNGLASALALLSNEQKELGSWSLTSAAARRLRRLFRRIIKHTASWPWGRPSFQRPGLRLKSRWAAPNN